MLTNYTYAQSSWVPSISYNIPTNDLNIDDLVLDHQHGFSIGIDYRSNSGKAYFNPGIHLFTNNADIFHIDTLNASADPELIGDTKHSMLKLILGGGTVLSDFGNGSNLHLRGAFIPTFKIGSADYGNIDLREDTQKEMNLEFLVGLGVDIKKFVLDFNFYTSLLKGFEEAHEVQNSFSISLGYRI